MSDFDAAALTQLEKDIGAEMMPIIFKQFLSELDTKRGEIERAASQHDLAQLAEGAHSLIATARTLGLVALSDWAAGVEQQARAGLSAEAFSRSDRLLALIDQGRQQLNSYQQ